MTDSCLSPLSENEHQVSERNRARYANLKPSDVFGTGANGQGMNSKLMSELRRNCPEVYRELKQRHLIEIGQIKGDLIPQA